MVLLLAAIAIELGCFFVARPLPPIVDYGWPQDSTLEGSWGFKTSSSFLLPCR
jgi:hypothetical protein